MATKRVGTKRKGGKASSGLTKRAKTYGRRAGASIGVGFPEKMRSTLRYFAVVDLGAATFSTTKNFFSANGMFDPDLTNVGHQPLGFDQLMTIYNHYVVLGSKIKVTFFGREDTNASGSAVVGIYADDSAANSLTSESLVEGSGTRKWGVVTASDQKLTLRDSYTSNVVFGNAPLSDLTQRGTPAANPSEVHAFCVWATNEATTTESVYAAVEIEYDAVFFERADLPSS